MATGLNFFFQDQNRAQEIEINKENIRKRGYIYEERKRRLQKICSQYNMTNVAVSNYLLRKNILFHPLYEVTFHA